MKFVFHAVLVTLFTAEANLSLALLYSDILLCVIVNAMVFALQNIYMYSDIDIFSNIQSKFCQLKQSYLVLIDQWFRFPSGREKPLLPFR